MGSSSSSRYLDENRSIFCPIQSNHPIKRKNIDQVTEHAANSFGDDLVELLLVTGYNAIATYVAVTLLPFQFVCSYYFALLSIYSDWKEKKIGFLSTSTEQYDKALEPLKRKKFKDGEAKLGVVFSAFGSRTIFVGTKRILEGVSSCLEAHPKIEVAKILRHGRFGGIYIVKIAKKKVWTGKKIRPVRIRGYFWLL